MVTKGYFVVAAMVETGLASSAADIQPDDLQNGVNRLDSMMAEWDASGIHVGYPLATPTSTSPATETSVYPYAVEAIALNLAIRLAPSFGRQVMPDTKANAKAAKDTVILRMTSPPSMHLPNTMPAGAGNRQAQWGQGPFLVQPDEGITVADEGELDFNP